ncbi:general substrate transporter [Aspergillus recurvatus]
MAGGAKKPVNIFQLRDLNIPAQVLNWRLWFAVVSFGVMGAARGVDEGLISGAFNSEDFQKTIHYSSYTTVEQTNIKANVSAMVQIGSVGGAIFAFVVCDRIGRLWATRQLCIQWIVGIAIFMGANGNLGAVYAGRFIAGLGVGQTTVVGPVYLAEVAPAAIRGLCTCVFTGFVYLGIVVAYFANYGCQIHMGNGTHNRWLVPTSLHIMFAGLIFLLSFMQYESPRYLVKRGHHDKAIDTLARLRNLPLDHEYVVREITDIETAHQAEMEATMGSSWFGVVKETFCIPRNLYRLYLTSMVQLLSQWSGAGSITLYAPDFFKLLGVAGQNESLLVTAVFGIIKLAAALICALFLVDVIGRKRALLIGITLQAISMAYIAGFLTSPGGIAMIYLSGFGWAMGWNSMQYLLTAELFPLRIRAFATSLAMTLHFGNQYGNSRAVPNLLLSTDNGAITPKGTFWFFTAVTIAGGLWVWFSVPETAGQSLETMDRLFELPWYKIGLYGNRDADERDLAIFEKEQVTMQSVGTSEHVERR